MLGQSARFIWRTCKYFLTVETGCMDPTNIIMFLLFFCVTGEGERTCYHIATSTDHLTISSANP